MNPTRARVIRVLTAAGHTPARRTRRKLYDVYSYGFRIEVSKFSGIRVHHEVGNISVAYHPDPDGAKTVAALASYTEALRAAGYTATEDGFNALRVR